MASLYRVEPTGPARQQMRELVAKVAAGSERQRVVRALRTVIRQLQTRPQDWGDPERQTRMEGGVVYHGIEEPLIVWYVVFEPKKVVWLVHVRALPNTSLAD